MTQTKDCSFLVSLKKDPMDYTLQAAEIWGAARVEFGPNKKAGFKKKDSFPVARRRTNRSHFYRG